MKFCLKCLNYKYGAQEFCEQCGSQLVDWNLTCECGWLIRPSFTLDFPLLRKVPLYKYCPNCGARIDKIIISHLKSLRRIDKILAKHSK